MRSRQPRVRAAAVLVGAMIFTVSPRLEADPWSLVSCDPSGAAGWQAFAQAMRTAKPGSPLYVPVPFPITPAQVVQDFTYQYWKVIEGLTPKNWQPSEARVMADLKGGNITFQVVRVENWTVSKCSPQRKNDYYQLVRVFEPDGTEVTRAVVNESGLATTWNHLPAAVPGPVASQSRTMPPAATAMAQLNSDLGLAGIDPEYVVTFGSLECGFTHPCLAFHQSGLSYVAFSDQIFEISSSGPHLRLGKEIGAPAEEALLRSLGPSERLVSLGGKAFTVGRQVTPAMIRSRQSAFGH